MTSLRRLLAATAATTALLAGLTACGGDDTADTSPASDSGDSVDAADSGGGDSADTADTSDEGDEADSPAGGVVFVDTVDTPATTVMIGEAGSFAPSSVSIAVGDVVKFSCGEESGVYSIVAGDLSGYTVTQGIDEFFRFDKPGTYAVFEEISEATMTVTVE